MSSLKQNIRSVLSEVESFLVETLKSVKLNGNAKDQKDRLLEKIRQLLDEIPGSASSQLDSNASGGSLKMSAADSSSGGTSSGNLQSLGDDDSGYADNIPKKAVSELKNILQSGMLEKKKKSAESGEKQGRKLSAALSFKTWEQLYCVISGNIMYMYKKQGDSKQKEAFCLSGYEIQEAPGLDKDASRKEMCFEVIKAGAPTYQFRAGSKEGMVIWKESIVKGIQIAAEEEPGEEFPDYDDASELYMEPSEASYKPLHHHHQATTSDYDDCGEEIYDDIDNDYIPSYPAPPVPRASTLPRPPVGKEGEEGGYENMSPVLTPSAKNNKTTKPASSGKSSTGAGRQKTVDSESARQVFAQNKAGEGHVRPSDIKKATTTNQSSGAANKRQGPPPPKIDIYKENGSSENSYINLVDNGKKTNNQPSSPPPQTSSTNSKGTKAGETNSKPRPLGQGQGQGQGQDSNSKPSGEGAPTYNKARRTSGAALFNKNRDLPPTPPASESKSGSDASGKSGGGRDSSPPSTGAGVGNLKKLFEK